MSAAEFALTPQPPYDSAFLACDDGVTWMDYPRWIFAMGWRPDALDLRSEWTSPGLGFEPRRNEAGTWVWVVTRELKP